MEQFYFREYIPPIYTRTLNLVPELFHFKDVRDLTTYLNEYKKDPDFHFEYYKDDDLYAILSVENEDNVDQKRRTLIGYTNCDEISKLFKLWKGKKA